MTTTRDAAILAADLPYFELIESKEPVRAEALATRLRQVLEEAIHERQGVIATRSASLVLAEMPSVASAVEAAWSARDSLERDAALGDPIEARFVIHRGGITWDQGLMTGSAAEVATGVLASVQPLQILVSMPALESTGNAPPGNVVGLHGGVRFFEAPRELSAREPEPAPEVVPAHSSSPEPVAPRSPSAAPRPGVTSKMRRWGAIAAVAVVLALLAFTLLRRNQASSAQGEPAMPGPPAAQSPAPKIPTGEIEIAIGQFSNESSDPRAARAGATIRLSSIELLRCVPRVRIVEDVPGTQMFAGRLRESPSGIVLVPTQGGIEGPPIPITPTSEAILAYARWAGQKAVLPVRSLEWPAAAIPRFSDAVTQILDRGDTSPKAVATIRAAIAAAPDFSPAHYVAMDLFAKRGEIDAALSEGAQVLRLTPDATEVRRSVARWNIDLGNLSAAIREYNALLSQRPADIEALEVLGLCALSAGDEPRFRDILARIPAQDRATSRLQEPDLLLYKGRIDQAVRLYYDLEAEQRQNAALFIRIGRAAVLRHSIPIADLETQKLKELDPDYGYHLLRAYVAAELGRPREARDELQIAMKNAKWQDTPWTAAAEVFSIARDTRAAVRALETAVEKREPAADYILNNPLFRFLASDPRFPKLRSALEAQKAEVREALIDTSSILLVDDATPEVTP